MLGIRNRLRPMIRVETLVLVVLAWLVATANGAWWSTVGAGRDWTQPSNWLFVGCCFVLLVALHFVLVAPFAIRWFTRPLLTALVVVSAGVTYFMHNFAVIMDPTMIQNVLRTDRHEAGELFNVNLLAWVLLWSALPVARCCACARSTCTRLVRAAPTSPVCPTPASSSLSDSSVRRASS